MIPEDLETILKEEEKEKEEKEDEAMAKTGKAK